MRYAPLIAHLGWITVFFAVGALIPALAALAHAEFADGAAFGGTAGAALFTGTALVLATRDAGVGLSRGDVLALATVTLPFLAVFGALPLVFTASAVGFTDAFFEAVSGLTTTGAGVLDDEAEMGHGVRLWRAWLQWVGGFAFVVFAVALAPLFNAGGMAAFRSAVPAGERATPEARLQGTARALGWVYGLLTGLAVFALSLAGMAPFDALLHSFATLSTGGFAGSIEGPATPRLQAVSIALMLIGATNMTLFWALFRGRWRPLAREPEFRWLLLVALVGALALIGLAHVFGEDASLIASLYAAVAALTTTGFVTPAATPPAVVLLLLLALAALGGMAGSTAGGVKLLRAGLAVRQGLRELARLSHPHAVLPLRHGDRPVDPAVMPAVWGYFIVMLIAFAIASSVLAAFGLDALSAVILALGAIVNAGAGLPELLDEGVSYAALPMAAKWVLSLVMIAGRLEFVVVVATLTALFWRR